MSETMRAIVYRGPNDLRMESRPIPEITEDEALLRVGSSSICGTDLRIYHGEASQVYPRHSAYPGMRWRARSSRSVPYRHQPGQHFLHRPNRAGHLP